MTTRRRTAGSAGALLTMLAAFTTLVTACGGGGRLSAHEYVRQASAICRNASQRADDPARLARRASLQDHTATALEELRPPESMAHFDTLWVALVRQSAAELEALVVSSRTGDHERAAQLRVAVATLTDRAAELARARGIAACPRHFTTAATAALGIGSVETGT